MTDQAIPQRPKAVRAAKQQQPDAAPTPTQEITGVAKRAPVITTDEQGRQLKVKYLGMLDHMRITRVLGAELSKNDQYKALASLAFCITEIDGDAVPQPVTVKEVEFLVDRLGEEGARAIGAVYVGQGWSKKDEEQDEIEIAKN